MKSNLSRIKTKEESREEGEKGKTSIHSPNDVSDPKDLQIEQRVGNVASLDLWNGLRTEGVVAISGI
jgi:hypothetical protein